MIDKETLKKHNLKAVPFSCIRDGETFHDEDAFWSVYNRDYYFFTYLIRNGQVFYADSDTPDMLTPSHFKDETVYVPVWRVCKEVAR